MGHLTQTERLTQIFRHTNDNFLLLSAYLAIFSNSELVTLDQQWKHYLLGEDSERN